MSHTLLEEQHVLCVSLMLCVCLGDCWRNDIARQCELCVSMNRRLLEDMTYKAMYCVSAMMLCVCLGDCWRNSIARQCELCVSMMFRRLLEE